MGSFLDFKFFAGGGLKNAVLAMAAKVVKASEPKKVAAAETKFAATVAVKTVRPELKREILTRDKCCQYRDKTTGRVCGSAHFLEIDHIQPQFAQGENRPENLRVLCKSHNIYRYKAEMKT